MSSSRGGGRGETWRANDDNDIEALALRRDYPLGYTLDVVSIGNR
jgi:hypothetical protein